MTLNVGGLLIQKLANFKRTYISITKLCSVLEAIGEAHITDEIMDNKTIVREGALL